MPLDAPSVALVVASRSQDLAVCRDRLVAGSKSFHAASRLLPRRLRDDVTALYAFCRVADDLVDEAEDPARGAAELSLRIDAIYQDRPFDDAADRALTRLVQAHGLPRAVFDLLLEGMVWDAEGRDYPTLEALEAYCVRVASTVGVAMSILMGTRDRLSLARACDLGVAMQLTNIARDVGEDARRGRLYLPSSVLRRRGLEPHEFLARPRPDGAVRQTVLDLLDRADQLYGRGEAGIARLPGDCRGAIRAASRIYADIGRIVRQRDGNSIDARAHTSALRKLVLLIGARLTWSRSGVALEEAPPLDAALPLLDAAAPIPRRVLSFVEAARRLNMGAEYAHRGSEEPSVGEFRIVQS